MTLLRPATRSIVPVLGLLLALALAAVARAGEVKLPPAAQVSGDVPAALRDELMSVIGASWRAYVARDARSYAGYLHPAVRRLSQRSSGVTTGRDAVLAGLTDEWRAFEKDGDSVSEALKIRKLELSVNASGPATAATALYWIEAEGGSRWDYTDQGLVFQAFSRHEGAWKIVHQIDGWSLGYDLDRDRPGEDSFLFDFAHPVTDLDRSVSYYREWLGEPAALTTETASFDVGGVRFVLDRSDLGGVARPGVGAPAGYARFLVRDLDRRVARLKKAGAVLIGGDDCIRRRGPDRYALAQDPSGNVFMLLEESYDSARGPAPAPPSGLEKSAPAAALAAAWLRADAPGLTALHAPGGRWFDATRVHGRGLEAASALAKALPRHTWSRYDRSPAGLSASWSASDVEVVPFGARSLVSYRRTLEGRGAHPFRETAFVTHLLDPAGQAELTMLVPDVSSRSPALALDYTGYPVTDLKAADRFYRTVLGLDSPYSDDQWRGFYGHIAVFGIYTAVPRRDRLPRPGFTAGYVSFWVKSARDIHAKLRKRGARFPIVPAITGTAGVDEEPGYRQVYTIDSEGCGVLFTEYTGRSGRSDGTR